MQQAQGLDPYHWFKALIQYREVPHAMTTFKRRGSLATEQKVFQVGALSWSARCQSQACAVTPVGVYWVWLEQACVC